MTTREEIIAVAKEAGLQTYLTRDCHWTGLGKFYAIAFEAGAASRDAEIQRLQMALADAEALELGTAEKCNQLRAELVNALAACKAKDEALQNCEGMLDELRDYPVTHDAIIEALGIQPDDAALKAWLGEPVAEVDDSGVVIVCRYDYKPKDKFYSPKGLK